MREVCFLIGADDRVLWSDVGTSPVALADSRSRWEAIWRWRDELVEIAHSHPVGPLAFSREDETTMSALVAALPRAPRFSVVAPAGMVARIAGRDVAIEPEPPWTLRLRRESGMTEEHESEQSEVKP
jgi:hypothetical protein